MNSFDYVTENNKIIYVSEIAGSRGSNHVFKKYRNTSQYIISLSALLNSGAPSFSGRFSLLWWQRQ